MRISRSRCRIAAVNAAGDKAGASTSAQTEAANAVAKFGALGTYLANLRDEATRERYTQADHRSRKARPATQCVFRPANSASDTRCPTGSSTEMNSDCIKSAKELPL